MTYGKAFGQRERICGPGGEVSGVSLPFSSTLVHLFARRSTCHASGIFSPIQNLNESSRPSRWSSNAVMSKPWVTIAVFSRHLNSAVSRLTRPNRSSRRSHPSTSRPLRKVEVAASVSSTDPYQGFFTSSSSSRIRELVFGNASAAVSTARRAGLAHTEELENFLTSDLPSELASFRPCSVSGL